jgi:hypothetical protein
MQLGIRYELDARTLREVEGTPFADGFHLDSSTGFRANRIWSGMLTPPEWCRDLAASQVAVVVTEP